MKKQETYPWATLRIVSNREQNSGVGASWRAWGGEGVISLFQQHAMLQIVLPIEASVLYRFGDM